MKPGFKSIAVLLMLLLGGPLCFPQSQSASEHLQKAQSYLRENRPDLAIPELKEVVALDPANVNAQGNLGVLLFFQNKFADAVPYLRAAVAAQPGLAKIHGLLGIAEFRTQNIDDARNDLEAAFPLIEDKKFKEQVGLELVGLFTNTNDLADAAPVIAQLQKDDPESLEVMYAAYRTYSELSVQSMLSLTLTGPDSAQTHEMLAHEEIKRGDTNAAVANFRKAIAIDPNLPGVHFDLAELLKTSQNPAVKREAEKEYRQALAQNPLDARAERRLGEIDEGFGLTKQAYAEYQAAVKMQPADPDANLDLAKILIQLGERDKALPLLEKVVQEDPTIALAHLRLSQLYRRKGMVKESDREVAAYKRYTELKEKLNASYKQLQVQPQEIHPDDNPPGKTGK
ncbi:MAG: tetratricopeptide repeat protein [Acidobacteriaceae bacterium]